ncbi:hypothetical protein [Pseudomonas sp. NY8896]|uniref:hypothetical protein n=1 Tax=Pseudomonas sp. NY8896 TaxID=3068639 RepID=UPI0031F60685
MNDIKNSFLFILEFVKRLRFVKSDFKELVDFARNDLMMQDILKFMCWPLVACLYLMFVCALMILWTTFSNLLPLSEDVIEYLTLLVLLASLYIVAVIFEAMKGRVVNAIKNWFEDSLTKDCSDMEADEQINLNVTRGKNEMDI